ncbi:Probable lipoprotein precursor [Flavobacterium indicum GPTSA100-9 = DSM 17447]|uniref:Probable lipoprotein n=1 Tax=Flavobacterium indicum (strain DSM 17447 / CIP 109464 / GPTSA100-9) TaxID=1094466 RepID=H8XVM1_FLAIG|nr:hypothetical protein [Flavobacterium indicum]CCG53985.1 Probable lipoprotein precursor [Flavobacterium indicum GPTSA100-9 = DSM 17447]
MKLLKSYLFMIVFLVACSKSSQKNNSEAIARVNDNYLYRSDLENLVPPGSSKKDSIAIVKDFITRWAIQQLLMNKAEKNISKSKQQELDELISQYKNDLYTKSYLEELVMTKIDTVISNEEIEKYYNEHKNNFKTTEPLVKLRYINLIKGNVKFATINSKFLNFSKKDKLDLQKLAIQFKNYAFNDSIWVDINQVYEKLPFINQENKDKFVSAGIAYQYTDSNLVWMVKVKDVVEKNNVAPLQYIQPTIKQIILNNRKTDLINKIQTEITNDAIKDNDFEIFK